MIEAGRPDGRTARRLNALTRDFIFRPHKTTTVFWAGLQSRPRSQIMSSVPHYWFRIPLEGTADHLKKAKAEGGKDAVKREIGKDAQMKGKTLENTEFANDELYCDAEIDSRAPLTREECDWFRERWDITRHGHAPCRPDVRPSD